MYIIFSFWWLLISCNYSSSNSQSINNTPITNQTTKSDSLKLEYPIDSILNLVNKKGTIWVETWVKISKDFSVEDFQYNREGYLNESGNWENIRLDSVYYSLYKKLFYYSNAKEMYVDIYSYRIGLTRENNQIVGYFDADAKIIVADAIRNKNKLLFTAGTIEMFDDCIWIDNDCFLLLGSQSEYVNGNENFRPFIFIYKISVNYYWRFTSKSVFNQLNESFFKEKFPEILVK